MLKKAILYFLNHYETDAFQRNQAILVLYGSLITNLVVIITAPLTLSINSWILIGACLWSLVLGTVTLFYFRKTHHLGNAMGLFALNGMGFFFCVILITDGILSPFIVWLAVFPSIAILLNNKKMLIIETISLSILVILSALLYDYITLYNVLSLRWKTILTTTNLFSVGVFFTLTIWDYYQNNLKVTNKLLSSNQELERFAYVASHDMKEPLRSIVSFSQLLKRKAQLKLDPTEIQYLEFIINGGNHLNDLIQDVLQFSQLEQERQEDFATVDLNQVVMDSVSSLGAIIQDKNASVTFDQLPTIRGSEIQLVRLFQNLIENGLKYNVSAVPTVAVKTIETEKNVQIYFTDNGIGIAPQYREQIFEMFKRLHRHEEYKGTGIGLALCKKITQLHQGNLSLWKSDENGSVFLVELPKL